MIENLIIILVVLVIVALSSLYVYKTKKNGKKCIGCPYSKECEKNSCCD